MDINRWVDGWITVAFSFHMFSSFRNIWSLSTTTLYLVSRYQCYQSGFGNLAGHLLFSSLDVPHILSLGFLPIYGTDVPADLSSYLVKVFSFFPPIFTCTYTVIRGGVHLAVCVRACLWAWAHQWGFVTNGVIIDADSGLPLIAVVGYRPNECANTLRYDTYACMHAHWLCPVSWSHTLTNTHTHFHFFSGSQRYTHAHLS